jgi:hypothetical protein
MRNKKLAAVLLVISLGCLVFGVSGPSWSPILIAMGIMFIILAYAANRRPLPVDPITGEKTETGNVWDEGNKYS